MKTELWWHFCNFTQLMGSTFSVLSNPCPLDFPAFSSLIIPDFFLFLWFFVLFIISSSCLFFFFFFEGVGGVNGWICYGGLVWCFVICMLMGFFSWVLGLIFCFHYTKSIRGSHKSWDFWVFRMKTQLSLKAKQSWV